MRASYALSLILGFVVGVGVSHLAHQSDSKKQITTLTTQQTTITATLVRLGEKGACKAETFEEAAGVESLVLDTMKAANAPMPEDARHKIELCAENLRPRRSK